MGEWIPTDFEKKEMNRLVHLIPETDPRTSQYSQLLVSIEQFLAITGTVNSILNEYYFAEDPYVEKNTEPNKENSIIEFPKKVDPAPVMEEITESDKFDDPNPTDTEEEDDTVYESTTVKNALGKAKKDGLILSLADWIEENIGVKGFNAIPAAQYGKVMRLLREMGVDV